MSARSQAASPPAPGASAADAERHRLAQADSGEVAWRDWGPYVSERAWGTVREDYSADGDAWSFFPHDHARSRVYRWNEDGMAGFCDESQTFVLSLGLWNGKDPILKERMFGLTGPQGNHGEDVKDYWWYLDGTPTHSWQTWRYHYPQGEFPYLDLVETNGRRSRTEPEYELVDTGTFSENRYWVVTVDYAKAGPQDLLMRITVENAGPDEATLHVLPTLWYRNTWSWGESSARPELTAQASRIVGTHPRSGRLAMVGSDDPQLLFCDNETNTERLFAVPNAFPYPKDGINDHIVDGADTVNPDATGTKAALDYTLTVPAGESRTIRVRLVGGDNAATAPLDLSTEFDGLIASRKAEADAFYASVVPAKCDADTAEVVRQAYAGLLWSKQFFHFDVNRWLQGDPGQPAPPPGRGDIRNADWLHVNNHEVLLMPDPWEYPWYAAWDLAFHCVSLAHIDPFFAKSQLVLLLREWYTHPNGQIPAYEWNFSDVNPPVHAWAALRVFDLDGGTDYAFLTRIFHKLLINFTWWTNNKERGGNNLFQGGFMGLDNIAPIDRSAIPPETGYLEQADSTAWMAKYALDLLEMAMRLAVQDHAFEDVATKFFEHFLSIAYAANSSGLWDDADGYFYDVLHLNYGQDIPIKVRSLVGLIPVTATGEYHANLLNSLPDFAERATWYLNAHPEQASAVQQREGVGGVHRLLSVVPTDRLIKVFDSMFEESGLLSQYGIRSISAYHREHPVDIETNGVRASADYEPAESTTALFGGNSNWRGPIWFPLNALLIEALRGYSQFGDEVLVEYPAKSGRKATLGEIADDLVRRLVSIFVPGPDGRRPVHGSNDIIATDPRWKDNIPFHEYFHGDTGQGLGAMHQTGWTALIAHLILDAEGA